MTDHFRRLANEFRARAEQHDNAETRSTFLAIAATYEAMMQAVQRAEQAGMRLAS